MKKSLGIFILSLIFGIMIGVVGYKIGYLNSVAVFAGAVGITGLIGLSIKLII